MYIRPKKVFWTLVLLLALLYVGAHLAIRTSWVRGLVLQRLSARTGYAFSASDLRFTPGLALSFKDFRLDRPASAGAEARTVAEAPWLRLGRRCGGWSVRAPRARLEAFREAGVWTPSQATGADECPGACVFPRVSPALGNLYFDLSDAQVSFVDGDARTAFVGVSWTRAPVRIPGRAGAVQNRLSWLKGPIRDAATADLAMRGSDEWYELPGGIARLATQGGPAVVEPRAESADVGVIGGDDGPTSIWLTTKNPADVPPKEAMVEAFREFFQTDPETAKAFFDAADEARSTAEPVPEANAPSEPPPAPAEAAAPAESVASTETAAPAAPAADGGASSPSEPPPAPADEKPAENAASAAPAADGGASSPSEPPPAPAK